MYMVSSRIGVRESLIVACAHATFLRRHTDFFFRSRQCLRLFNCKEGGSCCGRGRRGLVWKGEKGVVVEGAEGGRERENIIGITFKDKLKVSELPRHSNEYYCSCTLQHQPLWLAQD